MEALLVFGCFFSVVSELNGRSCISSGLPLDEKAAERLHFTLHRHVNRMSALIKLLT